MQKENLKVLMIHGFEGSPNGGWRPWLMGELGKQEIYAASLVMPSPAKPVTTDWEKEIEGQVKKFPKNKFILVGHSLGVPAILNFLQHKKPKNIFGCVLVSGPYQINKGHKAYKNLKTFFAKKEGNWFSLKVDYMNLKKVCKNFVVIHGDNDEMVPFAAAEFLSKNLDAKLVKVKNGGHLNGSAGWYTLPQALVEILHKTK